MANAVTSSAALNELKTNLTSLSKSLHMIYDLMNADMSQIGQEWQDRKYEEFVEGYRPQINKCEEISIRYNEWCQRVLAPTIDNVIAVETTNVGSGNGHVSGGSAAGSAVSATTSAAAAATGKGNMFNMSGGMKQTPQSDNQSTVKKIFAEADEACQLDNRSDKFRAKLAKQGEKADFTIASKSSSTGDNFTVGGKVGGKVEIPVFKVAKASASIEGEGKYNSGVETTETTGTYAFKCVEDNPNQ